MSYVKIDNPTVKQAEDYIWMVGNGDLLGCVLVGPAGMGKTKLIQHTLKDQQIDYAKLGGHLSTSQTYEFLYENRKKLVFLDDVSQVVNNREIMELLKQALDVGNGKRILHYRTKNSSIVTKPKFEFEGRIIMTFNTMDKNNPNVDAILSRAPSVEMNFSYDDVIKAMYKIAKQSGEGELRQYEKMLVTKEIEDYTDPSMNISLRTQAQAFKIYKGMSSKYGESTGEWKRMVHKVCGDRNRSWIYKMVKGMCGVSGKVKRKTLALHIAEKRNCSVRTAQRRIKDFLEVDEIYQDKAKQGSISLQPFK